jgi:hypothetical protein
MSDAILANEREAALPLLSEWVLNRFTTPRTISASSSDALYASSENPKPSPPQPASLARIVFHLLSTKEAHNEAVFQQVRRGKLETR